MSIFGAIEEAAGFVGSLPEKAVSGVKAVVHKLAVVWHFLVSIAGVLSDAWTWVVNGVFWLGDRIGAWAGEVYRTLWQTLVHTVPDAIAWVFSKAAHYAAAIVTKVYNELHSWVLAVERFVVKLVHDLVNALGNLVRKFIHWATAPVQWVLRWGAWLIRLITHPGNLANWIAGAILEPVIKWFLKAGASVVVWFLRLALSKGSPLVLLIEDVLHEML